MAAIILVRHTVKDYDAWRLIYDNDADRRKVGGCTGTHVFRNAKDGNEVIINLQWDSVENAQKFLDNPDTPAAMAAAGVVGQPDVWFVEDAGRTAS
jgi:heme-degrading monooxygenase HmoA